MSQEPGLRQRISARTDDDLLHMVNADSGEYTPEAVEFARGELRARNYIETASRWLRPGDAQGTETDLARCERRLAALEARLPTTSILSSSFWSRACAVYGHALAVHLIVMLVLGVIIGVLALITK